MEAVAPRYCPKIFVVLFYRDLAPNFDLDIVEDRPALPIVVEPR